MKSDSSAGREFLRTDWEAIDFERTDQALKAPAPSQEKTFGNDAKLVDLIPKEKWNIGTRSIVDAILSRQSRRKYEAVELTLEELSFLLFATQGVKRRSKNYSLRTVPSGGARHPFETYVYADKVAELPRGLYRYLPLEGKLCVQEPYREGMEKEVDAASNGQFWNAAAFFIWSAIPYRTEWRYAAGAHKIIAIDAGHLCENLYLACEAIGCGTCGIGAYNQKLADRLLKIDGVDEFAFYMAPVGKIAG